MFPLRYPTILLDLDHTLLDSDSSEALAFEATLTAAGASEPQDYFDTYNRLNKALWKAAERGEIPVDHIRVERFRQLIDATDLEADPNQMGDNFAYGLANFGELFPGTIVVLDELAKTRSLALVTNGISIIQRTRIDRLGLATFFDAIVISSEIGTAKPHPQFFDAVFDALADADPASALMVGDNLSSDIGGARSYGIDTCWYNPNGASAGSEDQRIFEIRDIAELLEIVS